MTVDIRTILAVLVRGRLSRARVLEIASDVCTSHGLQFDWTDFMGQDQEQDAWDWAWDHICKLWPT